MTKPAAGINRSQPSAGGAAANNATLAKEADSSRKPTGRDAHGAHSPGEAGERELEGDNQQRGQHKERRQILPRGRRNVGSPPAGRGTVGCSSTAMSWEARINATKRGWRKGVHHGTRLRVVVVVPVGGQTEKEHRQRQKKYSRAGEGRYAESRSRSARLRPPGRSPLPVHRIPQNSANHSARLRFPLAWLRVPARASRASIDGENRAPPTPVRQAPRIMGHSDAPHASRRKPATRTTQRRRE